MPNRKSFDEKEKYEHSSHPIAHRQAGDLKADVNVGVDEGDAFESAATKEAHARDDVSQGATKVRRKPRSARRTG
jgi:hypothetical protein